MRYLFLVVSLAVALYYTAAVIAVPNFGYVAQPQADGIRVLSVLPSHAATSPLQAGDLVLAVDGISAASNRPLYAHGPGVYTHQVQRSERQLTLSVPVTPRTFDMALQPLVIGVVAFASILVAGLALFFAARNNRGAWLFASTAAGLSIGLAASEASLYNVPTAAFTFCLLTPLAAVGFVDLALLPWKATASYRRRPILIALYIMAAGAGFYTLFRLQQPGAYTPWPVYGIVAAALVTNPLLLFARYLRLPTSHSRRQVLILLILTCLAALPLVMLTIVPRFLWGAPILPWKLSFLLLLLLPLAYLYVLLRGRFLGLDLFVTKTLTLLLIALLGVTVYALLVRLVPTASPALSFWLSSLTIFGSVMLGLPLLGRPLGFAVDSIIFGETAPSPERRQAWTAALARQPERSVLQRVFQDMTADLDISRGAFYQRNDRGRWECVASVRLEANMASALPSSGPEQPLLAATAASHPLFQTLPWADLAVPFRMQNDLQGLFVLGPRAGGGIYHDRHIEALQQLGDTMIMTLRLVEQAEVSLAMTLKMMQNTDRQRRDVSLQLHDEPLYQVSKALQELSTIPEPGKAIAGSQASLQLAVRQLRQICAGLRPPLLDQGIHLALADILDRFEKTERIRVQQEVAVPLEAILPAPLTAATYHVVQEALQNVSRHAQANNVWVSLRYTGRSLQLVVEDDGRGCDTLSFQRTDLVRGHHFGIAGMHDRAADVGGSLTIGRSARGGLLVRFEAPLLLPSHADSSDASTPSMPAGLYASTIFA